AATATVTAAATAAAATSAATTATEAAFRFRPGFVHHERASVHLLLMELADRLRRVLVIHHLDECEAAGPAGGHVPHHPDVVHLPGLAEQLRELLFRRRVGEVPDVESPAHAVTYSWTERAASVPGTRRRARR